MNKILAFVFIIFFFNVNGQSNIDLKILTSPSQTLYVSGGLRVYNILEILNITDFKNITIEADTGAITKDSLNRYLYYCEYSNKPQNVIITVYKRSKKLMEKKYPVKGMPDPFLCLTNNYREAQHGAISKKYLLQQKRLLIILPNTDYVIKDVYQIQELTIKFPDNSILVNPNISLTNNMINNVKALKINQKIEAVCRVHDIRNNKDFYAYGHYTIKK